jgi:signal transduction histidine kinase/CheY-like chemotaxis protein
MSALNAHINGETRTFEIEYRARTKSGSWKWLLTRGRVVERNSAGLPLHTSGTNIDMTEKKHLEEQLRQAQKMESVGLLAGGIAHDFNNILTVILGHANLQLAYIRKRPETEDRIAKSFEQIGIAAERAASLTRQLLAFSRKQVTKLETISPERIVVNLEPMLQRIIGEHIRMHIVQNASGGHIRADAGLIEQAIMNLVVNARDAMPDGGIITLEVSTVDPSFEKDLLGLDHFGSPTVRMIVRDTGVGMSHETIERIFEPFYTTKPIGKGTGLGLATVYGIVQQFKGHITVSSVVGEGTVFKLYFPAAANPVENEETKGNVTMVTSGNETVLLCEDEEIVRELMRTILSRSGYELLVAESGKQALGYIRAGKTADLLITDVVMPDMNGKRLAEGIIEEHGRIPILYVSGYTPEIIEGLDLSGETTDFLNKPFLPVELLQKVRQLLDFSKTRDGNHIPA